MSGCGFTDGEGMWRLRFANEFVFEVLGSSIHRIPARQKSQGHPRQAQAEDIECLVEFIRLVERGVNVLIFTDAESPGRPRDAGAESR